MSEDGQMIMSLLPTAFLSVATVVPLLTICRRVGKTRWWSALALIPFLGVIVVLYFFAYSRWPAIAGHREYEQPSRRHS